MTQADKIALCCILRAKFTEINNLVKESKITEATCLLFEIIFDFLEYEEHGIKCNFTSDKYYITEFTIDEIKVTL